jgi:hypothetical protein
MGVSNSGSAGSGGSAGSNISYYENNMNSDKIISSKAIGLSFSVTPQNKKSLNEMPQFLYKSVEGVKEGSVT